MTKAPAWNVSSAGRRPTVSANTPNTQMPNAMPRMVTAVHIADCVRPKPNRVDR